MRGVLLAKAEAQSLKGSKQVDTQTLESKQMIDAATSFCYDARGLIEYVVKSQTRLRLPWCFCLGASVAAVYLVAFFHSSGFLAYFHAAAFFSLCF